MSPRMILILGAALALAGCGGSKKETGGKAEGEILEASVSDAMLPYDTVRSQAPLSPKAQAAEGTNDKVDEKAASEEEVVSSGEQAEPEPALAEEE